MAIVQGDSLSGFKQGFVFVYLCLFICVCLEVEGAELQSRLVRANRFREPLRMLFYSRFPMKAVLSPSAYAALTLKLVGTLMIIGSIGDCLLLLLPPNFLDQVWLSALIRDWILRGTVPLIGFALLLLGSWVEAPAGGMIPNRSASRKKLAQSRSTTGVVFLALCYSILFVLLIPLYFNSSRLASATETRRMNEQAAAAQQELSNRLNERREQINLLLSDNTRRRELQTQLKDADNPLQTQFSAEQRIELQQMLQLAELVAKNPAVLEQELRKAQQTGLEQIKTQQQQQHDRITAETRKLRIHTIVMAILLAIGYGTIAWTGMSTPQRRSARSRVQA